MKYTTVSSGDFHTLTVLLDGELLTHTTENKDEFVTLLDAVLSDDESRVRRIISPVQEVKEQFRFLSDRVSVKDGVIYFDWDPVHNAVTDQIVKFLEEGHEFGPLVNFMTKLHNYRTNQSVDQLYSWLLHNDFTLNEAGNIVGYKSVSKVGDGVYVPSRDGHAFVNDVEIPAGRIRQSVGDIVSLPRSEVTFDPDVACASGLHIANRAYAESYVGDTVLIVEVDPRDVVSVPNDSAYQKIRAARYRILDAVEKDKTPDLGAYYEVADDYEDYYEDWEDSEDDCL